MIPDYTSHKHSHVDKYCWIINKVEREKIRLGLQKLFKPIETKIQKIVNDPNNEGQVTYSAKIDNLRAEYKEIQQMITELSY